MVFIWRCNNANRFFVRGRFRVGLRDKKLFGQYKSNTVRVYGKSPQFTETNMYVCVCVFVHYSLLCVRTFQVWVTILGHTSHPFLSFFSETRLQELRGTLTSVEYTVATEKTVWAQRQVFANVRAKTARPVLLDAKLSAERVIEHICNKCNAGEAVIRCLDCVPLDTEFLCGSCDIEAHKKNVFHNREAIFHGYLEPIPPTKAVSRVCSFNNFCWLVKSNSTNILCW